MPSSLRSIREAASALRAALLTPSLQDIGAVLPALQQAAVTLDRMQTQPPDPACRADLEALAREWRAAARLAAQGGDIARGTLQLLAAAASNGQTGGYRADGEPVPVKAAATVVVRG